MTRAAREVLDDCRGAIDEISDGVQGSAWRRRWVTAVALLRIVGHVLEAVDSNQSANYKAAIKRGWVELGRTKPEPAIFWRFIDEERNNIIHEYEIGAGQGVTVYVGDGRRSDYHYTINTGPFAGRDQRDVLREAVAWWEGYLDGIDKDAA